MTRVSLSSSRTQSQENATGNQDDDAMTRDLHQVQSTEPKFVQGCASAGNFFQAYDNCVQRSGLIGNCVQWYELTGLHQRHSDLVS